MFTFIFKFLAMKTEHSYTIMTVLISFKQVIHRMYSSLNMSSFKLQLPIQKSIIFIAMRGYR